MRRAVLSLLNTPAGRFAWYEDFPRLITTELARHGIDHIVGYKSYLDHSTIPPDRRLVLHDERDALDASRVRAILEPLMAAYDKVILHTHSYSPGVSRFAAVVRRHRDAQWWITVHGLAKRQPAWRRWYRGTCQALRLRYPSRVYGCSETSARSLRLAYPAHRTGALVNGRLTAADAARFEPRGVPRTALLVSRLIPAKGIWIALEAAEQVAASIPDFRLLVVGDGSLLGPAQGWVTERHLEHSIAFAGYQPEVQQWYQQADLLWVPTIPELHREGLPLVALEAQGHALPVLYSSSGGLPESQIEGVTGLLVDPIDAGTLARRTLELLRNEARYHSMRRSIVEQRHRWTVDRMVNDYVGEYLNALAR